MQIHRLVEFECTPKTLWRCLTEDALMKQWIPQLVDKTPDDPQQTGLGAQSTLRMRQGDKIVSYRNVVTAWEPERLLAIRLSGGALSPGTEVDVRYEISQDNVLGCVLDYDVTVPMRGLIFKLLSPLISLASSAQAKKVLAKLKTLADGM